MFSLAAYCLLPTAFRSSAPLAPPHPCSLTMVPQQRGYVLHEADLEYHTEPSHPQ